MATGGLEPPRAVIVGPGHSGTGYISTVLNKAGAFVGHEGWYNPYNIWRSGLDVDASWLATPSLGLYRGTVWHQVRNPLKTVTSLAYTAAWSGGYFQYRKQVMREVTGDRVVDGMTAYVDFSLKAEEHATRRWRVEDVNAPLIRSLLKELGIKPDTYKIRKALETETNTNPHWKSDYLGWDELPDHPIKDELRDMATRYGYET